MSFILDALKKAEAERQRQTGPTLLEVRVAQPRRRFPAWTLVIGALLGINIVLLIFFVLRRPTTTAAAPAAAAIVTAPVTPVGSGAATAVAAPAATVPATSLPAAPLVAALPPAATPAVPTAGPALPPDTADASQDNPADFEPAVPASGAAQGSSTHHRPPSLSDVGGDIPDLRLDLHVYAVRPADRYALINMHRVKEGDVLPEGPRVVAIDRDGVEMIYHGTEFMLHPQ